MSNSFLYDYQKEAISKMRNGCILNGGVGTGKSRTSLYYYFQKFGGSLENGIYIPMKNYKHLIIITTARKRDTLEWEGELAPFLMSSKSNITKAYDDIVDIDSWNNIKKYENITNAFFIFDEQRVVGKGAWVKAFLKIAKNNEWILLSATPGDTWSDYIPVFLANGFYRNKTEFEREHIVYSRFTKYPSIDRYINTERLIRLRNRILINMDYKRKTIPHHEDIYVDYDRFKCKDVIKKRWNPFTDEPIAQASELCYCLRKIVNQDKSRIDAIERLIKTHPRVIIFYNFDYELDILRELSEKFKDDYTISEWNGHKHQEIPNTNKWIYLVQYTAGAEGWNCIKTDTIIFYSQNYSYKILSQSCGRIDRLNTPYTDLYYYHLKSRSGIDLGISKALAEKKNFNERKYANW